MKVEIPNDIIGWINDTTWHTKYKGVTAEQEEKMITEDVIKMIRHYINRIEGNRDEWYE